MESAVYAAIEKWRGKLSRGKLAIGAVHLAVELTLTLLGLLNATEDYMWLQGAAQRATSKGAVRSVRSDRTERWL